jgi:long-chain acyl-CoA synthetase
LKIAKNTICDLFSYQAKQLANKNAIGWIDNDEVKFYSFKEYQNLVESLSLALLKKGVIKQDKICILGETSKEWHLLDLAILCAGAVTVPIYHTYLPHEIEFIINHAEAKMIIVENDDQFLKVFKCLEKCKSLKFIVNIEKVKEENIQKLPGHIINLSFKELVAIGSEEILQNPDTFKFSIQEVYPDDTASIVYTSGTTGEPKGAVITHGAFTQMLLNVSKFTHNAFNKSDRNLIFLPLSHVLGRCDSMLLLIFGNESVYAESIDKLIDNIQLSRPTFMTSVPRIFEKIYSKIKTEISNSSPIKQVLFDKAMKVTNEYYETIAIDKTPSTNLIIQNQLAYKLVFKKIYEKFGGRIRFFITGGAPISVEIIHFLRNCNLTILEGYGLTETIAPCSLNPLSKQIAGTVGQPIGDVEFKFAKDNEILIKSKALFKEYYKNPEATDEAFEGEWFKSGDIGHFNTQGYLVITDRKKDIIITSAGKNIAPQKLENLLKVHPEIASCVIVGDKRNYITALICLDRTGFSSNFINSNNLAECTYEEFSQNQIVVEYISGLINQINENLASFETVKKFTIINTEFTTENFLTPSLKVKRKLVLEKYKAEIDAMYQ